jgi:hypothetical protein
MSVSSDGSTTLNIGGVSSTHQFLYNESGGEIQLIDSTGAGPILLDNVSGLARLYKVGTGAMSIGTTGANYLQFITNGSERMRIDSSGNLGIGESSPGSYRLNVKTSASQGIQLNGTGTGGSWMLWANNGTANGYIASAYHVFSGGSASDFGIRAENNLCFGTSASERMRIASGGNVGIGTSSPSTKLVVSNGGAAGLEFDPSGGLNSGSYIQSYNRSTSAYTHNTNYASAQTWYSGNGNRSMDLDSSGNVAIGTSAAANRLTVSAAGLDITGGNAINGTSMQGIRLQNTLNDNSSLGLWFGTNNVHWAGISGQRTNFASDWATDLRFYTHEAALVDVTYARERMRIDGSGNVGIGNTIPGAYGARLAIGDPANAYSNTLLALTQYATFSITANGTSAAAGTTFDWSWANGGQGPLKFSSSGTERMRINSSGNVGIGTSSPSARLHVFGGATRLEYNVADDNPLTVFNTSSTGYGPYIQAGVGVRYALHVTDYTGTSRMLIQGGGNVGIGITDPGYRLDVAAADTTVGIGYAARLRSNATATAAGLQFTNAAVTTENGVIYCNDAGLITVQGSAAMAFRTNGSERARISPAGGFSVGTTADPGAGAIFATGNITAYYSDDRLKTRLGDIDDALGIIDKIDAFYYEANETAKELGYEAVREVGVSAQSVQRVLPEVVAPAPIDAEYLTVRYERLVPVLIQAIKELTARVAQLEGK